MKKLLLLMAALPALLLGRAVLEFYFWWKGPVSHQVLLPYFLQGYRCSADEHQKSLRAPREISRKWDRRMCRIAFPRSVSAGLYRGWRREEERQRRWIEATKGPRG